MRVGDSGFDLYIMLTLRRARGIIFKSSWTTDEGQLLRLARRNYVILWWTETWCHSGTFFRRILPSLPHSLSSNFIEANCLGYYCSVFPNFAVWTVLIRWDMKEMLPESKEGSSNLFYLFLQEIWDQKDKLNVHHVKWATVYINQVRCQLACLLLSQLVFSSSSVEFKILREMDYVPRWYQSWTQNLELYNKSLLKL